MRKIASFADKAEAERFLWFLSSHQIACHQSDEEPSATDIWVLSDDDLPRARALYASYKAEPTTANHLEQINAGKRLVASQEKDEKRQQRQAARTRPRPSGRIPISLALVGVSSAIFLLGFFGQAQGSAAARRLLLGLMRFSLYMGHSFPEIQSGQIWRLVTPIFLHDGLLHIFFNMMWLWLLARHVELVEGSRKLLGLVIFIAATSHIAFYLVAGPNFGGMSGVNYGLAAYIWGMEQWDGGQRSYRSDSNQTQFFVVWYIVCLVLTIFGMRVANTIHSVGALAGLAVAFFGTRRYKHFGQGLRRNPHAAKPLLMGLGLLLAGAVIDFLTS